MRNVRNKLVFNNSERRNNLKSFRLKHLSIPLLLCGIFYAVLCVFSIVTGIIYMTGRRKLNPLELSDKFMERLSDPKKLKRFTVFMGFVTVVVGIVQGITSFAIIRAKKRLHYRIALGFTLFSIGSVAAKLKGKISAFPLLKAVAYVSILVVLLLKKTRGLFSSSF